MHEKFADKSISVHQLTAIAVTQLICLFRWLFKQTALTNLPTCTVAALEREMIIV